MEAFFQDVFTYHRHFNQVLMEQLGAIHEQLPEGTIPLMSHVICAHQIWTARILNKESLGVHDVYGLPKLLALDLENYHTTLEIIERHHADEIVVYHNSKGEKFKNSIRDILFHVANHTTHHRAQLIQDIRRSGFEPPVSDYIFFRR